MGGGGEGCEGAGMVGVNDAGSDGAGEEGWGAASGLGHTFSKLYVRPRMKGFSHALLLPRRQSPGSQPAPWPGSPTTTTPTRYPYASQTPAIATTIPPLRLQPHVHHTSPNSSDKRPSLSQALPAPPTKTIPPTTTTNPSLIAPTAIFSAR